MCTVPFLLEFLPYTQHLHALVGYFETNRHDGPLISFSLHVLSANFQRTPNCRNQQTALPDKLSLSANQPKRNDDSCEQAAFTKEVLPILDRNETSVWKENVMPIREMESQ
jgi:hypothetical protein